MSLDMQTRGEVFALAKKAVIGVAAARLNGSESDAAFVIGQYHSDAQRLGVSDATSWALLFSASIVSLTDTLTDAAEANHQSPAAELSELALRQEQS